jgi:hypothetical protein
MKEHGGREQAQIDETNDAGDADDNLDNKISDW